MRLQLPGLFLERMQRLLGDEYPAFLASYEEPAAAGLRVNTLKLTAQEFAAISPYPLRPVGWCAEGFWLNPGSEQANSLLYKASEEEQANGLLNKASEGEQANSLLYKASEGEQANSLFYKASEGEQANSLLYRSPGKHPYHAAGLYYLQDPAAMAAVSILDPQPGERILDLCGAPGGKSTAILARLQGQGCLVANEIHPKRAWDLAQNLERFGARNAAVTQETPERLAEHFEAFFDRVLLDAPCSGEGMFRKSAAARHDWTSELVQGCALRQAGILEQASLLVRPGGWLAYVTCTFAPEEDEAQIANFLAKHNEKPRFELVEVQHHPAFAPGRTDWAGQPDARTMGLEKAVRMWPHKKAGDGHFIALMQRVDDSPRNALPAWQPRLPKDIQTLFRQFCQESLTGTPDEGSLLLEGQYLYRIPEGLPRMGGVKTIHPGWWLGEVKKDRFEPSHALALGLEASNAQRTLALQPDSLEIRAYLRGETLDSNGDNGWVLVCVDSPAGPFPLGWGRRVNDRVKNHYPKGLRSLV